MTRWHIGLMPKRISKRSKVTKLLEAPKDPNQLGYELVRISTQDKEATVSQEEIVRVMREMGRRGGQKGGKRRMETLTPERRSLIAHGAAKARWEKEKKRKK